MTRITIEIELDEEIADDDHSTGMTVQGYEALVSDLAGYGEIVSGPNRS